MKSMKQFISTLTMTRFGLLLLKGKKYRWISKSGKEAYLEDIQDLYLLVLQKSRSEIPSNINLLYADCITVFDKSQPIYDQRPYPIVLNMHVHQLLRSTKSICA